MAVGPSFLPGGKKSNGGATGTNVGPSFVPGAGSGSNTRGVALTSDLITRQLRNAIGAGNVPKAKRLARELGVSGRTVKGIGFLAAQKTPKTGFGSILPDLATVVNPATLAKGLGEFGFGLGKEAIKYPAWRDIVQGKGDTYDIIGAVPIPFSGSAAGFIRGAIDPGNKENLANAPAFAPMGESFRRTYERLIHPTRLAREYSDRPVLTALEDLGNIALVGGAVGKGLSVGAKGAEAASVGAAEAGQAARAARLGSLSRGLSRAASRVGQVENVANITVNAPFLPYSAGARLANRGLAAAGERLGGLTLSQTGELAARYPKTRATMGFFRVLPEDRILRNVLQEAENSTLPRIVEQQVKPYLEAEKILPDMNEQIAMHLTLEGTVPSLAQAKQFLPEEQFVRVIKSAYGDAAPLKAVNDAIDAYTGRNADLAKRIAQGIEITAPSRAARGEMLFSRGRLNRAEQLGFRPQETPLERALTPYRKQAEKARQYATRQTELAANERARVQTTVDRLIAKRESQVSAAQRVKVEDDLQQALYKENETFQKALRRDIRAAKKMRDAAKKQYEGLREQYQVAVRTNPNWAGMGRLRAEVLAAYQDYSRLVTEWSDLTTQIRSWPQPTRQGGPVPKMLTERQVRSKLPAEGRATFMENQARRAERRALNFEQRLAEQQVALANNPAFSPARLRQMQRTNLIVQDELRLLENEYRAQGWNDVADTLAAQADGVLTTLEQFEKAGIDAEQIIHARVPRRPGNVGRGGQRIDDTMFPRDVKRMEAQKFRTGKGEFDLTFKAQAEAIARRAEQEIRRQVSVEIANLPFMHKANDPIFLIRDEATGEMRTPRINELPDGWEAWSPRTLFGNVTGKGPLSPETIIGPADIINSYRQYFRRAGKFEQAMRVVYDPTIQTFKVMVLPLWPAWNVVNVLGNAFLSTFVAGETPIALARAFKEVLDRRRTTGTWEVVDNPRLYQAGQTLELRDFINPYKKANKFKVALDKAGSLGFKANELVDNMFRSAVYIAKKSRGYSDEQALRLALDSMGDFSNLSRFERQVVRRAVPFYTWMRHMTKVAFKLPIEHPWRTAWMLSLAQEFSERDPWENLLPTYSRGTVDLGGGTVLSTYNISPFTTPLDMIRALTEGRMPSALTPVANVALQNIYGINPLTGAPFSRQPGTGRISETGIELPTAPPLEQQLINLSPQLRFIQELTGRKDIARYGSGQPVMVRNEEGKLVPLKAETTANWKRIIGAALGGRTTTKKQLKDIVDAIIVRQVNLYKAANPQQQITSSTPKVGPSVLP